MNWGYTSCGGRGRTLAQHPARVATARTSDAALMAKRWSAPVDDRARGQHAIADGFQIYLHSFGRGEHGEWAVVQQGLNDRTGMARGIIGIQRR